MFCNFWLRLARPNTWKKIVIIEFCLHWFYCHFVFWRLDLYVLVRPCIT
jgi:hypothetical protein